MSTQTQKDKLGAKRVITPTFRVSFPAIFKPKAFEGQEPKYSIVMLFSKKDDISKLKDAARAAIVEKWGADKSKHPKNLRLPFRDGDDKQDLQGYAGCIYVSASSKTQAGLVDQRKQPILVESDFYAGCYARAEIIAFAYDKAGNKGVSFALQNVQKIKDGDAFSGRKKAEDVFDSVEDGSDDESNYSDGSDSDDDLGI